MARKDIQVFAPDTPNWKVMNAVRNVLGNDYRQRVPAATQADISQSLEAIDQFPGGYNAFATGIINKIGLTIVKTNSWENPLAPFKIGKLALGESIEIIQTGLLEAYRYDENQDFDGKFLFGRERPEVQAEYHKINRKDVYKITVDETALRKAFTEEGGLAKFITELMEAPTTSDNWDEYLAMRQLFAEYEANGGFFKVNIPEVVFNTDGSVAAKQVLKEFRAYGEILNFPSRNYNASRMPVHAKGKQLHLFTTPKFKASLDIDGLAALFNVTYAEVDQHITVIDRFGVPDIQAVLTTEDFFVVADAVFEMRSQADASRLIENFFLHHHQVISASRFVPAVAFTYGEGTELFEDDTPVESIGTVTIKNAEGTTVTALTRGFTYVVDARAVTNPVGGDNDVVSFKLVGVGPRSAITQAGFLRISEQEEATAGKLVVTSVDTNSGPVETTVDFTINGDKLELWPEPHISEDDDNDGKFEVAPEEPVRTGDNVTIPTVTGVVYKSGATTYTNGQVVAVPTTPGVTITAEARTAQYEIKPGADASWTFIKS